jgi:hypothetical protein
MLTAFGIDRVSKSTTAAQTSRTGKLAAAIAAMVGAIGASQAFRSIG